jgi:hypothetical protein
VAASPDAVVMDTPQEEGNGVAVLEGQSTSEVQSSLGGQEVLAQHTATQQPIVDAGPDLMLFDSIPNSQSVGQDTDSSSKIAHEDGVEGRVREVSLGASSQSTPVESTEVSSEQSRAGAVTSSNRSRVGVVASSDQSRMGMVTSEQSKVDLVTSEQSGVGVVTSEQSGVGVVTSQAAESAGEARTTIPAVSTTPSQGQRVMGQRSEVMIQSPEGSLLPSAPALIDLSMDVGIRHAAAAADVAREYQVVYPKLEGVLEGIMIGGVVTVAPTALNNPLVS